MENNYANKYNNLKYTNSLKITNCQLLHPQNSKINNTILLK